MNNDQAINIIKSSCESILPDCRILLFGSRTRADYSDNSDFDLLIVTTDTIDAKQKLYYKSLLRKKLAANKIPVDIIIQSEEEITQKNKITGHIVKEIIKEGVAI